VIEDRLREGLTRSSSTQIAIEAERLHDGQIGLDVEERSAWALLLVEDVTSPAGEDAVDAAHGVLGNLNLDKEDGLEESRLGQESCGVQHTTSSGNNLATTTVDGISVQSNIKDVEADGAHRLLTKGTLASGPLETGDNRILDFLQVLDGLGLVDQQVGASGIGTESPNLAGIGDIPAEVVSEDTGAGLEIVPRRDASSLDLLAELLIKRLSNHVQTVVLVRRLGQGSHARLGSDSLTVLDDRVRNVERNTGVVLLEILQANLKVKLTSASNDVLARLRGVAQDARIRLGQTLETFDKLGKIGSVLDLDRAAHDGRDRELHDLEVVGRLAGGEGTRLEQELVNADQTNDVAGGQVINGFNLGAHHQDGTLDSLDEEIVLLARGVVGTLDADLETGADGTGEDTAEGIEATLIGGRHHLGDIQHQRAVRVAVTDTDGSLIVQRTLVEGLDTILLGRDGRREVQDHHFQQAVSSRQESTHDGFQKLLALLVAVLSGKLEVQLIKECVDLILLEVHDSIEDPEDGVEDELAKGTFKLGAVSSSRALGPLLGLGVEVVVALCLVSKASPSRLASARNLPRDAPSSCCGQHRTS